MMTEPCPRASRSPHLRLAAALTLGAVLLGGTTACSRVGKNLGKAAGEKVQQQVQDDPPANGSAPSPGATSTPTVRPSTAYLRQGPASVRNQPDAVWRGGPDGAKAFLRYYFEQRDAAVVSGDATKVAGLADTLNCRVCKESEDAPKRNLADGVRVLPYRTTVTSITLNSPGTSSDYIATVHISRPPVTFIEKDGKRTTAPARTRTYTFHIGPPKSAPGAAPNQPYIIQMQL